MRNEIVTVAVITYNSSETIVETLDSIKKQTYRDSIEIVISDDFSTDNTVQVVMDWISNNESKFHSVCLIESTENLGITKNLNKAIRKASGKYIKLLSGDDTLFLPSSINDYINNIGEYKVLLSPVAIFDCKNAEQLTIHENDNFNAFLKMTDREKRSCVYSNSKLSPKITGSFFSKDLLLDMGLFDETYIMMEDYPFMVNIFERYYEDIIFLSKQLYNYRVRDIFSEEFLFSKRKIEHVISLNKFRKDIILPLMVKKRLYKECLIMLIKMTLIRIEVSNIFCSKIIYRIRKWRR